MNRLPRCECGKVWAPTEQQARAFHAFVAAHKGQKKRVRIYQCTHGGWHWTRQLRKPKTHT